MHTERAAPREGSRGNIPNSGKSSSARGTSYMPLGINKNGSSTQNISSRALGTSCMPLGINGISSSVPRAQGTSHMPIGIYTFQHIRMCCHVLRAPPTCHLGIYTFQQLRMCYYVLRAPPTCHLGIHTVTNAPTAGPRQPCTCQQQKEATQAGTG